MTDPLLASPTEVSAAPRRTTAVAGGDAGRVDPLTWVVTALATLPLVVAAVVAWRADWLASSDWALTELRVRDVGGGDTPLIGPYSRYGWYHPGPLLFWLLSPVYRLGGSTTGAMYAAAAMINAAAVAGSCVLARRLGGRSLLVITASVLAITTAGVASQYADPWNPYLTVLPLVLFLLAAAALAAGDPWALPVAVGTGSFVVQSHVGHAVVVGIVGVVALVAFGVVRRHDAARGRALAGRQRWGVAAATVAVVLVTWTAPVVQQVTAERGNLGEILTYFTTPTDEPSAGFSRLGTVLGLQLQPLAPWVGASERIDRASQLFDVPVWRAFPLLMGLVGAVVVGWRRRHRATLSLALSAVVATGAGVLATTRITGITFPYLIRFWWAIAMVGWMAVALAVWQVVPRGWRVRSPRTGSAMVVAAIVLAVAVPSGVATARLALGPPDEPTRTAIGVLAPGVLAGLSPGQAYAVLPHGQSWGEHLAAVINLLDANGFPVATHPYFITEYGEPMTFGGPGAPGRFAGRITVATNEGIAEFEARAGLRELARWDPLTPGERREMDALVVSVSDGFLAVGRPDLADATRRGALGRALALDGGVVPPGVDPVAVERIASLEERGIPVVVFLDPTPVSTNDLL